MNKFKLLAVALVASVPVLASPVAAAPVGPSLLLLNDAVTNNATPLVQEVQFRGRGGGWRGGWRGRGWGSGIGPGIALGILGGAAIAASRPWYGDGYGPSYGYGPGYEYEQGYYQSGYGAPGDDASYCQQRFRSYDPRSGTYLGYDGLRHSCP